MKEPHDVTVMRRDAVILDCQAHGESPIDVRWLKNGVEVLENERLYLLSNGSLYISEVESRRGDKSDEGHYQCLAQNMYGAILSQSARLTIASKCHHAGSTFETQRCDGRLRVKKLIFSASRNCLKNIAELHWLLFFQAAFVAAFMTAMAQREKKVT